MPFASRFVQVAAFAATSMASVAVAGQTPLAQPQPGRAQVPAWEQQQVKADHEAAEARLHVSRAPAELPSIRDLVGMATRRFIGCQVRDGRVDATLRTAHDILRVSAVQESQWGRFSDRVKVLMDQLKPACWAPPLDPAMPLQERLYRMSADSRTDVAVFQGLSQEVASIYAVLESCRASSRSRLRWMHVAR